MRHAITECVSAGGGVVNGPTSKILRTYVIGAGIAVITDQGGAITTIAGITTKSVLTVI
jgi:hypothetical protein